MGEVPSAAYQDVLSRVSTHGIVVFAINTFPGKKIFFFLTFFLLNFFFFF